GLKHAVHTEGKHVESPSAADHRFRSDLKGGAGSGLQQRGARVPETAVAAIGEEKAAANVEIGRRQRGVRLSGVGGAGSGFDRVGGGSVEAANVTVVAVRSGRFELVAEAQVQGEPAGNLEIILKEQRLVKSLVGG